MGRSTPVDAGVSELRAQFRVPRHLLEQSPSSAARRAGTSTVDVLWANTAPVVLAVADAGRDRLDEESHFAAAPVALYGIVQLLAACAYFILTLTLIAATVTIRHWRPPSAATSGQSVGCDLGCGNSRLVPEAARGVCSLRAGGRHLVRSRSSHRKSARRGAAGRNTCQPSASAALIMRWPIADG